MIEQALMMMGNLPLSLFYLSTIAFAMSYMSGSKVLGLLAPAGKMALTNYLMQSLIGSLVFYGYGTWHVATMGACRTGIVCRVGFHRPSYLQPCVVALFQIWPDGMVVAFVDLLDLAADASLRRAKKLLRS